MTVVLFCLVFIAGYVTSVYSWSTARTWLTGVETEVRSLEDKLKALKARL